MSLYLTDEKQYFPTGEFQIEHLDWVYNPSSGSFIPSRYHVTVTAEAGVLEFTANAVGCHAASGVGEAPDSPTILLDWDTLDGTFTYSSGRTRTLTNGLGGTLIRQWKPYPDVLIGGAQFQPLDVPRV